MFTRLPLTIIALVGTIVAGLSGAPPALVTLLAVVGLVLFTASLAGAPPGLGPAGRLRLVLANPELGAVTLVEAAKLAPTDLKAGVIETFVLESTFMDLVPFMDIEGNAFSYNAEGTLPGVEFRAVNSGYSESTGTVNQLTETLVILGGDADVDTYIVQTRGSLNDQRSVQTKLKVKAAVYKYQDAFINGDTAVDANSFDGLKKRLTGAQVIDAATNGLPIVGTTANDQHAFMDKVDELLGLVPGGADALIMDKAIRAKFRSAARRIGGWDSQIGEFGKKIETYDGVPLLDAGQTAAGGRIIPQTETQGTSNVATSIYAVHFGEDETDQGVTGLTNGGVQVKDLGEIDAKPVYRTRIEFFTGLGVFGRGAARLRGVLNS